MAKIRPIRSLINLVTWIVGILVALAVGFGMAQGTLIIPWLEDIGASILTVVAGWIVVLMTLIGALMAIIEKLS